MPLPHTLQFKSTLVGQCQETADSAMPDVMKQLKKFQSKIYSLITFHSTSSKQLSGIRCHSQFRLPHTDCLLLLLQDSWNSSDKSLEATAQLQWRFLAGPRNNPQTQIQEQHQHFQLLDLAKS
jgi:hypothetical protein